MVSECVLVARRQEHLFYGAETTLDIQPTSYQHAAGLTTYHNRNKFHAALVANEPGQGRSVIVASCPGDWPDGALFCPGEKVPVPDAPLRLRVEVSGAHQQFFLATPTGAWQAMGPKLDSSVI